MLFLARAVAITLVIGSLLVLTAVALVVAYDVLLHSGAAYDPNHPQRAVFERQLEAARETFRTDASEWAVIDLAPLNGGVWRTACLFGRYTTPIQDLEVLGATISYLDRVRFKSAMLGSADSEEKFAVLFAWITSDNRAGFLHLPAGLAETHAYTACVDKPKTKMAIQTSKQERARSEPPDLR